jgi:streptogramin lyase
LTSTLVASANSIEDDFQRPNQTGWGDTTNPDGVPNVAWGMDGDGSKSFVTITNNAGVYGYPGATNVVGIASSGSATFNGGDSLVKFEVSAVGHVTPYVVENACSDKSCYYGARLHTSQSLLEIAKRIGNGTTILASATFTPSANTFYWMRLDVSTGITNTLQARIWADGSTEPSTWLVTVTDASPLAANFVGAGGSWDQVGTGESISYVCYAYATSGLATACGSGSGSTATATQTSVTTSTTTPTAATTPTLTATPTVSSTPTATGAATSTSTATPTITVNGTNAIEDVYQRPNQTGWGVTTNPDGVPNVAWGMDGSGSKSFVTITNNTGVFGFPGSTNSVGIASAGNTAFNGGDSLVKFSVSSVGHVTPYVVQNACSDKSCYYGARLHTSQNRLELARRLSNGTTILATAPFTPSANTFYWMRLDVTTGTINTLRAKIWADGSAEPSTWQVTGTDSSPLAANLVGTGGSWDHVGTGESISYTCFAYATGGLAAPCGSGPVITTTPVPTSTSTNTPTPLVSTINEFPVNGVGEPWGTTIDAAGNVWFAEPGCDFSPTCSPSVGPGQLGFLPVGSTTATFYSLPNITGNQPIFVTLDTAGNVWFTTPNNSMIGEFNPNTQSFVGQWSVTAGSGPWDLVFHNGKLWYTEHFVAAVGEFDPSTHAFQDFTTPSASSNPYGIAASGNLVWFTENLSTVARIASLDPAHGNHISEYLIRSSLPSDLTPHLIKVDASGHPWWTEGFVRDIGTLNPSVATPGVCGTSSGDCTGVTEFSLPPPPASCNSSHVSGIGIQGGGSLIWLDDSLSAQVGEFDPTTSQFALNNLSNCGAHPHDGLNLDSFSPPHVWWDEEFANALGELTQ